MLNCKELKNETDQLSNISKTWFYLDTGVGDGLFNMACDSFLLDKLILGNFDQPVLRIYGWDKDTWSLGLNQDFNFDSSSVPIVKRVTGGQAVLHETVEKEITYSIVVKYGYKLKQLYSEVGGILFYFLSLYGLDASFGYKKGEYLKSFNCFESKTIADIVVEDKKVIGNAQYRKKEYILQHGSIKLDLIKNFSKKGKASDLNQITINLKKSFEECLKIGFLDYTLSEDDLSNINKIKNKYLINN